MVLLLTTLLSGCGALRLVYGQAPELVYWWLDGYVDFDSTQSEKVRDDLARYADWHRATQLPDYAQLLVRAQAQVLSPDPITPAAVCRWYQDAFSRSAPLIERGLPAAADAVMQFTPDNLKHIQRKYEKVNAKFRDEYLQPDPKDRLEAAVDRVVDRTESLYGRIDGPQKERIAKLLAASPFDPDVWFAERQQRQRDTLATLRSLLAAKAPPDQVQAGLRTLLARLQQSPREAYREYDERLKAYNCMVGAEVHNNMTREQRQEAAKRLKGWADDFRAMSAAR